MVLGGTSIFGGRGTIIGTLLGLILMQALKNGLALAGVKGDGTSEGSVSLNKFAPGSLYSNNAMAYGGSAGSYPTNNWFPATLNDVGFVNFAGGDYHLSGSSAYANKGYDGRNIGADIDQVNAATRNSVVGP